MPRRSLILSGEKTIFVQFQLQNSLLACDRDRAGIVTACFEAAVLMRVGGPEQGVQMGWGGP